MDRWVVAAFAIFGAFFAAAVAGYFIANAAGLWDMPVVGCIAAFLMVTVAYIAAPSHRLVAAFVVFVCGGVSACLLLSNTLYPESYGELLAYQQTYFPLVMTGSGGVAGLAAVFLLQLIYRR